MRANFGHRDRCVRSAIPSDNRDWREPATLGQRPEFRAGPGCLNSAPWKLSGFLPGYSECGALRF
ncbi:MAG: hypothetical protein FJX45_17200 [Alphaproteobacteria bacterium]|nr:hypothetical protein [Alphaproteobacteria bacterium]